MLEAFVRLVHALQGHHEAILVFLAVFTVSCLFLPVTIFEVVGGVLFGFRLGLVLNMAGIMLGTSLAFFLSRRLGRKAVHRYLAKREEYLAGLVTNWDLRALLIMRLLGLPPFWAVNYLAGLSNLKWRDYWAGTFFGVLPWMVFITHASNVLWQVLLTAGRKGFHDAVADKARPLVWSLVFLVIVIALSYLIKGKQKETMRTAVQEGMDRE